MIEVDAAHAEGDLRLAPCGGGAQEHLGCHFAKSECVQPIPHLHSHHEFRREDRADLRRSARPRVALPRVELVPHEPRGTARGRALLTSGQRVGSAAQVVEGGHGARIGRIPDRSTPRGRFTLRRRGRMREGGTPAGAEGRSARAVPPWRGLREGPAPQRARTQTPDHEGLCPAPSRRPRWRVGPTGPARGRRARATAGHRPARQPGSGRGGAARRAHVARDATCPRRGRAPSRSARADRVPTSAALPALSERALARASRKLRSSSSSFPQRERQASPTLRVGVPSMSTMLANMATSIIDIFNGLRFDGAR